MPAVLIGRLAIDQNYQRRGLGGALLADAARRAMQAAPAAFSLIVDAENDAAVNFHRHHGFRAAQPVPPTVPAAGDGCEEIGFRAG